MLLLLCWEEDGGMETSRISPLSSGEVEVQEDQQAGVGVNLDNTRVVASYYRQCWESPRGLYEPQCLLVPCVWTTEPALGSEQHLPV